MKNFATFMAGTTGRIIRAVAGLALIAIGLLMGTTAGYVVAAIGLLPLAAGAFDFCLVAPLAGLPFMGKDVRNQSK
jgi:hypothetical protein